MKTYLDDSKEIKKSLLVLLGVILLVVGLYFFTSLVVTKKDAQEKEKKDNQKVAIDYDQTIIGAMLNRPYEEYYVLIYDKANAEENAAYTTYKSKQAKKIYTIDINAKINAKYRGQVNDFDNDLSKFLIAEDSLLLINNGKITKSFIGSEEIIKVLS